MQEEGLQSAFPMEELTVFGFGAAVRAYPHLSRRMDSLVDLIIAEKPAAVLSVDVKGFSTNTSAAKSRVMDADFAVETANLTKNQILSQAATSMLAQANQSKQSILALLQ